MIHLGKRQN